VNQPTHIQNHYPIATGDINIYHARLIADQQVAYVLEFKDYLDLDRVQDSLDCLYATFPLLSCVLEKKGMNYQWAKIADFRPSFSLSDISSQGQAAFHEKIIQFISQPCDPENQPPLKVYILRTQDGDHLCFKVDHVLSDAGGLKFLLYLFAEAYRQGKITQPINQNRSLRQIFRTFSLTTLVKAARHADVPRPGPALISGQFDSQPVFIEHACLDPRRFEQVRQVAKALGATVNDFLLAALYQVVFERLQVDGDLYYPIMVPVDMRRYLPEEKRGVLGNLSSAVYPRLSKKPGEDFRGTLARVKSVMDGNKQAAPGLGAAILMTIGSMRGGRMLHDRYQIAARHGSRFINLTNFGIIDEAACNFGIIQPVQAYGVGPNQYAPGILIAVSTYRNCLHLVVQGNDTRNFQPFVSEILGSLVSYF
jgi:NRPS condensation-like uncharacterized protein